MDCQDALSRIAGLERGESPDAGTRAHLTGCPACRSRAALLDALGDRVREVLETVGPAPASPAAIRLAAGGRPNRRAWVAAAAALLLLIGGLAALSRSPAGPGGLATPSPVPADREVAGAEADGGRFTSTAGDVLEVAAGSAVHYVPASGERAASLRLASGACWAENRTLLEIDGPAPLSLSPGSAAELSVEGPAPALASLLSRDAWAEEGGPALRIRLISGEARARGRRIPPGTTALVTAEKVGDATALGDADWARIESWRARRIAAAAGRHGKPLDALLPASGRLRLPASGRRTVLSGEFTTEGSHLLIRYPASHGTGRLSLGNLPAWGDGRWHRLSVRTGDDGAEVFLDGRRILAAPFQPADDGEPEVLSLEARGAGFRVRALAVGEDAGW